MEASTKILGTQATPYEHLVAGLYNNLYGGNIYFDDFDIKKLNMNFLRKSLIGFVEQEPQLLADKIISNLYPYNINENYEPEEIDAAIYYINKLGMNDWLDKCYDGLNTYINEKSDNISGGEKQKLSIIRELLKKPLVLLLDEPTSAMDHWKYRSILGWSESIVLYNDFRVCCRTHFWIVFLAL